MTPMTPIAKFVAAAIDHGRYTIEGVPRESNEAHRQVREARELLRRELDGGESVFITLLGNEDMSVRTWAALFLLPTNAQAALATLDADSREQGLLALNARMTAQEWRAGRLVV